MLLYYPGEPEVKLIGLQADVQVRCVLIGQCRYRCCYIADRQGVLINYCVYVFGSVHIGIAGLLIFGLLIRRLLNVIYYFFYFLFF